MKQSGPGGILASLARCPGLAQMWRRSLCSGRSSQGVPAIDKKSQSGSRGTPGNAIQWMESVPHCEAEATERWQSQQTLLRRLPISSRELQEYRVAQIAKHGKFRKEAVHFFEIPDHVSMISRPTFHIRRWHEESDSLPALQLKPRRKSALHIIHGGIGNRDRNPSNVCFCLPRESPHRFTQFPVEQVPYKLSRAHATPYANQNAPSRPNKRRQIARNGLQIGKAVQSRKIGVGSVKRLLPKQHSQVFVRQVLEDHVGILRLSPHAGAGHFDHLGRAIARENPPPTGAQKCCVLARATIQFQHPVSGSVRMQESLPHLLALDLTYDSPRKLIVV